MASKRRKCIRLMSLGIRGPSSLELTIPRIRMYNKRIKDWKVMKNYKRKEKNAVCYALQKRTRAGKISHHVTIRDQPVKFHRILRHMKDSANGTDIQDSGGPPTSTDDSGVEKFVPRRRIFS